MKKIYLPAIFIFSFLITSSQDIQVQQAKLDTIDSKSNNFFLYVHVLDDSQVPINKRTVETTNRTLNLLFKDYLVHDYYQSFPGAKTKSY